MKFVIIYLLSDMNQVVVHQDISINAVHSLELCQPDVEAVCHLIPSSRVWQWPARYG